jgi:hypothetical protein
MPKQIPVQHTAPDTSAKGWIEVNSPYTKHLDAAYDTHSTAVAVPTYQAAPVAQPMVMQAPASSDSGGKAAVALVAIVVAAIACVGGYMIGKNIGPSWNELRRYEALAGREGEIRGRDKGWQQGRGQGRTEMQFLAKYEQLRTQATAFNQGWSQGLSTGRSMGVAQSKYRYGYGRYGGYYGGRGYGRGYGYGGYGYGGYGRSGGAVANAQALANATGQPVDVVIG